MQLHCKLRDKAVNSPHVQIRFGKFLKGILDILNMFISLNHFEDFIHQNHNPKSLRNSLELCRVKIQGSAWIGELSGYYS